MMRISRTAVVMVSLLAVGVMAGCGNSNAGKPAAEGAAYRLSAEPENAKGVKEVRDVAKTDEEVTVVGRIGGDTSPWVDGQAAFLVVDPSLKPCNEKGEEEACATPWDYCCDTDLLLTHKAMVKIVDKSGKTVAMDARKLLGVKESQTVVVRGQAKRDEAGNLTVLAAGVFVKP